MQKKNCIGLLDNWYSNLIIYMERLNTIYFRIYIRKYVYYTFFTLVQVLCENFGIYGTYGIN